MLWNERIIIIDAIQISEIYCKLPPKHYAVVIEKQYWSAVARQRSKRINVVAMEWLCMYNWSVKFITNYHWDTMPICPQINYFFWKCFKTNYWISSQNSFFIWNYNPSFQSWIMKNNFIQMAALNGHAVAYTIGLESNQIVRGRSSILDRRLPRT